MKKLIFTMIILAAAGYLSACVTGKVNIPDSLSPSELIQRAQEASDKNRYKIALQYYQALYDRNSTNIDLICAAEYEIAFIYYKQKKYVQAREGFNGLLERYDTPEEAYLPPAFKVLALKVLERIEEKEKKRPFFSRKS